MNIEAMMTREVVLLKQEQTIQEAMKIFLEKEISGAPVVDEEGHLVGICSETDILNSLRTRYKELKMVFPSLPMVGISFVKMPKEKEVMEAFEEILSTPIKDIMVRKIISIGPDANVGEAVELMRSNNINRVPVVENSEVVGIVTRGDVIKIAFRVNGD